MKKYIKEGIGTALLIMFMCGALCFSFNTTGVLGCAIVVAIFYTLWQFVMHEQCLCHLNPLLTFSAFLLKKISKKDLLWNIMFQLIGGIFGVLFVLVILLLTSYGVSTIKMLLNGFDLFSPINLSIVGVLMVEFVASFVLVLSYMLIFKDKDKSNGLIFGFILFIIVIFTYFADGSAFNPAKVFGGAVCCFWYTSIELLIDFVVISLIEILGAFIAVIVFKALKK